jgi:hypothetical protein
MAYRPRALDGADIAAIAATTTPAQDWCDPSSVRRDADAERFSSVTRFVLRPYESAFALIAKPAPR